MEFVDQFSDLTPIPQDDGPRPVVPIAYDSSFRQIMDIFRAVLDCDELSSRALELTSEVIDLNAANYTAWHFRRRCLHALGSDLAAELKYVANIAGDNPKNYQIWYHRRSISEKLKGSEKGELAYTAEVLSEDSKNYHAWSHRQAVVKNLALLHTSAWDDEMVFVESMLTDDVRNNSAWNQRWFVIHGRCNMNGNGNGNGNGNNESGTTGETKQEGDVHTTIPSILDDQVIRTELEYAFLAITKAPKNQSPWSYIEGLMRGKEYSKYPMVRENLLKLETEGVKDSPPMLACWINVYQSSSDTEELVKARAICQDLELRLDTVRAKYWGYRGNNLSK